MVKQKTKLENSWSKDEYKVPSSEGKYSRLQEGENRFRILSEPLTGWLLWEDKKPTRFPIDKKPLCVDKDNPVKHIWDLIVWSYDQEAIQILELHQATVKKRLLELANDEDWGDPTGYDIKISKTGAGKETKYSVTAVPHKKVAPEILDALNKTPINLAALFDGGDPFEATGAVQSGEIPF